MWFVLVGCVAVAIVETDADTGAECAPAVSYVWYTGADCTGDGYAADGIDGFGEVDVVSIASMPGHWCEPMPAHLEGAVPVCH